MVTMLKLAGLIFEQFGNLLLDEFFWIIIVIMIMMYRRNSALERQMLGSSYPLVNKTVSSVLTGLAGGLLGSLLVFLVGISLEDYTRPGAGSVAEGITYIWIAAILLSMLNPRYLCFSYAGGIVALMSLVLGFPKVNVPGLLALVGVLHLVESFLIWLDGYTYSTPLFLRRGKGDTVGGYIMNKVWPLPLVVFVVMFGNEGGRVSLAGLFNMPSWWPLLKNSAAGGIRDLIYFPLVVPVVLGYGDMAVTQMPEDKCKSSALRLAGYSLVLIMLSVLASKHVIFAFAAALFAPIVHEMLILYGAKEEEEGRPYFAGEPYGLKVLYVQKDSVASRMNIEPGDTLLKINSMLVNNERQLAEFLKSYPTFIWMDVLKASGKVVTAEYSDYRNGIGGLGALIVPYYADFYYEMNKGSSLLKRIIERYKRRHGKDLDV